MKFPVYVNPDSLIDFHNHTTTEARINTSMVYFPYNPDSTTWVKVGEIEGEVNWVSDEILISPILAALEAEEACLREKFQKALAEIQATRQNLLCLEAPK